MVKIAQTKKRYQTIKSVYSMVQAMQIVTMTRLQRLKGHLKQATHYKQVLEEIAKQGVAYPPLVHEKITASAKVTLLCVISSNRGFCSGFNETLCEKVAALVEEKKKKGEIVKLVLLGKKAQPLLKNVPAEVVFKSSDLVENPTYATVAPVFDFLLQAYLGEEVKKIELMFNAFTSIVTQKPFYQPLLPLPVPPEVQPVGNPYLEPSPLRVSEKLARAYLFALFYDALLQSVTGEMGRRLVTLKEATENSGELLKNLRLALNKARQAAITQELAEIISTFEILREEWG